MRYGVYLPSQGPFADVRLLAELAREAETAGWDGLFIWDEIVPIVEHSPEIREALEASRDLADPFIALTAVAAATERLRFGALVTPVARPTPSGSPTTGEVNAAPKQRWTSSPTALSFCGTTSLVSSLARSCWPGLGPAMPNAGRAPRAGTRRC